MRRPQNLPLLTLFLVLAACGGGGGGGTGDAGAPPLDFVGSYAHIGAFGIDGLEGIQSIFGSSTAEEAGLLDLQLLTNVDGGAVGRSIGKQQYLVHPDDA